MGNKVRLFLAGVLVRPRVAALAARPGPPAQPRQERPFGRPFQYLVEHDGVLVPVTVAAAGEWDPRAASEARRAVEDDARAMRN